MHTDLQTIIIELMGTTICDTLCNYLCSISLVVVPPLSYAQNPTSICSLQLIMILVMPKKPIYAVVRARIMGQGLYITGYG